MRTTVHRAGYETQARVPASMRPSKALTLIELLAVILIITAAGTAYLTVRDSYGTWPAVAAGFLAGAAAFLLVVAFCSWASKRDRCQLAELREKYRHIYRVKALPTDERSIVKRQGAEIRIGDYCWEALPHRKDGLIHAHGLTRAWHVVWHASFRPDQLEEVASKPCSQYDHWVPYWVRKPPPAPCPFPVQPRNTPTMGLPHHSGCYLEEYAAQDA